jgi:hypothetical protein
MMIAERIVPRSAVSNFRPIQMGRFFCAGTWLACRSGPVTLLSILNIQSAKEDTNA